MATAVQPSSTLTGPFLSAHQKEWQATLPQSSVATGRCYCGKVTFSIKGSRNNFAVFATASILKNREKENSSSKAPADVLSQASLVALSYRVIYVPSEDFQVTAGENSLQNGERITIDGTENYYYRKSCVHCNACICNDFYEYSADDQQFKQLFGVFPNTLDDEFLPVKRRKEPLVHVYDQENDGVNLFAL